MTEKQSKTKSKSGRQKLAEMTPSTAAVTGITASGEATASVGAATTDVVNAEHGWQRVDYYLDPTIPVATPVQFLFFKEPQRIPGSQSASSLTSYTDAKTSSRHTIDWLPHENQFRIVYHPANHPTETRYIFSSSISNYARFDPGETYGLPHGSALRPKE